MYQLFVGEIGFSRREFLYDLRWWEIRSIIRGYNSRQHPSWEQARMIAHQVHYCMGLKQGETAKTPTEWVTFPWERTASGEISELPSDAEVERLRQMMREENARIEANETK